ncbi:SEC-C metal-binding domain-containing protein [Oceanobacillus damuensis]|uniref:SEC-C metal-binding domain-containing protein n=1 Tax=Oceanobacillus damuensis TaxID=937928 RepID=UPI0008302C65|nr:SEC-C metal-binding domain-containing protein [Oceanobacillus damuensis]
MNFLEKVEPFIISDDKHVRDFVLEAIDRAYLGTEHTFLLALQAMDKLTPDSNVNPIVPYTRNLPVTEKVLLEVLKRLDKKDENHKWYLSILDYCPTDLFAAYQEKLTPYVKKTKMAKITKLQSLDTESLFMEAGQVMNRLERKFDDDNYLYGKRIFQELIERGEYDQENFKDIRHAFENESDEEYMSMNAIYNAYVAGEQKASPLIQDLAVLLVRAEEDLLIEEVVAALIKIGSVGVLEAVEKYIDNEATAIGALDIVASIKHPAAEEILLRYFDKEKDITTKTLIAESLCLQLSTKAIPKLEQMLEDGFDAAIVHLAEVLYPICVINKIDHPRLAEWKQDIVETDSYWELEKKKHIAEEAKSKGIGRNDPCICGSGKKFKKCCGA